MKSTDSTEKKLNLPLVMAVYLLGIFMGALDTGIVTPARTIIQDSLGVGDKTGIWMITIYTLAYAASIPVMGKLADRMGRRSVYLVSIFLFGLGSLLCGFAHSANSFTMLLITRAVQAIGGGGIVPIANAEFGTTFPEEKRGMALGMVGGVYGIANIFGASAGSAVLDFFGTDKWEFIFYINVPIAIFILIAGFFALPNSKDKTDKPIDGLGTCVLVVMVLSLMYGLKNIDFFNFKETIANPDVYGFLIAFVVLLPIFVLIEKRAADPVMNLKYFTNIRIVLTLLITVISGIVLMGVIFVPQFCENGLKVPSGSGGYFVIILGLCAGIGAMTSGKMTDHFGPKPVLAFGFIAAIIGSLIVIFFSSQNPNKINVFASLIFIGLGIGFTMGAPLNYIMLGEVDTKEANSALATLSLVRSLGTVIAPAIMVGFIANAGAGMMDEIMGVLPGEIKVPELPYAAELTKEIKSQNIEGAEDMPDLTKMTSVKLDMNKNKSSNMDVEIPDDILTEIKNSDVTTITTSVKDMSSYMFDQMSPKIQKKIDNGISKGIDGVSTGIDSMNSAIGKMQEARAGMEKGIDGMGTALKKQNDSRAGMIKGRDALNTQIGKMQQGLNGVNQGIAAIEAQIKKIQDNPSDNPQVDAAMIAGMQKKLGETKGQAEGLKNAISQMTSKRDELQRGIDGISAGINQVQAKRSSLVNAHTEMGNALAGIENGLLQAQTTQEKMITLRNAIPGAFDEAKENYLAAIDAESDIIEDTYQSCLNVGFRQIFMLTAIGSAIGLILLALSGFVGRKESGETTA